VEIELRQRDMLAGGFDAYDITGEADAGSRQNVFFASDLSENFVKMIRRILGEDEEQLNIRFKNLDI